MLPHDFKHLIKIFRVLFVFILSIRAVDDDGFRYVVKKAGQQLIGDVGFFHDGGIPDVSHGSVFVILHQKLFHVEAVILIDGRRVGRRRGLPTSIESFASFHRSVNGSIAVV